MTSQQAINSTLLQRTGEDIYFGHYHLLGEIINNTQLLTAIFTQFSYWLKGA